MAETVGALIFSSLAAAGVEGAAALGSTALIGSITVSSVVGAAAILGTSIGLQYALANKQPDVPRPSDGAQAIKQAAPSRQRGYGRCRLAGAYVLFEEANGHSYDIIAFHQGQISNVVGYYLHDDPITIDADGVVADTYDDGRYGKRMIRIETRSGGAAQPASWIKDAIGMSEIWTSAHQGNGIAWASLDCASPAVEDVAKIYPRGKPELSVVAECTPVWDPRDPAQSEHQASSWKASSNPVLALLHYITAEDGGLGEDRSIVVPDDRLAEWMVEADLCDELVDRGDGGREPRYALNGFYKFENNPESVINQVLSTCDGWLSEAADGSLALVVGMYREPAITITEKHMTGGFSLDYGQPDEQLVNQLDVSFVDPDQHFGEVQTGAIRNEVSISEAGAERSRPLALSWVQSGSQAQRLGHRAMQRLNPQLRGTFSTTLYGLAALGHRWVRLQYPYVSGLQDCVVEITGADRDLAAGRVVFSFQRIAPDKIEAYVPEIDEGYIPTAPKPIAKRVGRLDYSKAAYSSLITLLEDI